MVKNKFASLTTEFGKIFIFASDAGVTRIVLGEQELEQYLSSVNGNVGSNEDFASQAAQELGQYFAGERTAFTVKLDISQGTDFQRSVWRELIQIPFGSFITYGGIAKKLKNPKAARAVGSAVGTNPIPIVVPCHRVVGCNGLGGFYYGPDVKRGLLKLEGGYNV